MCTFRCYCHIYTPRLAKDPDQVINQHRIWAKHMVLIPKEEQFCNMEVTWQKHDHRLVIVK